MSIAVKFCHVVSEPNPYKPSYEFPSRTIDIHSKKSSGEYTLLCTLMLSLRNPLEKYPVDWGYYINNFHIKYDIEIVCQKFL